MGERASVVGFRPVDLKPVDVRTVDLRKYGFEVGKRNPSRELDSADATVELAVRASVFIERYLRETDDGVYWDKPGYDDTDLAIYGGAAGISYFHLKLSQVTGDERYRDIALRSARYLAKHWEYVIGHSPRGFIRDEGEGGYYGIAGIGFVLAEEYRAFHDETIGDALRAIGDHYVAHALYGEGGAYWTDNISLMGDGAVILFLLELHGIFRDARYLELAVSAGDQLLTWAEDTGDGALDFNSFAKVERLNEPNFELGAAGAGYVLLSLFEHTGEERYRDAALGAWRRLEQLKRPQEKGFLIPYRFDAQGRPLEEDGRIVYYLGTCHGPAGTARFYYKLYQVTGDRRYWEQVVALADGLEALGAPERQSAGYWNSYTYCCGPAALLQFYVALYQVYGSPRWLDLAKRTAETLAGLAEDAGDGAVDWPVAWTRVRPDEFSRRIGYFDGAAGIASTLLQYALVQRGAFEWSRLPDDPFPNHFAGTAA